LIVDEPEIVNRLIIPPHEAEKLVTQAGQVYLQLCPCRVEKQACPPEKWEVCLLFETASEKDRQQARLISNEEAVRVIRLTAGRGDIHQLFYLQKGEHPQELCNCCACCCFPLREAKEKGNYTEQLHCGYVAVTDELLCTACGTCLDSCFFEARQLEDDTLRLIDARCFGCGRCITDCPAEAIQLEFQTGRGVAIPSIC
jgi:Pyruvate/2-oxoacid:ferredoxin oxidoreductase delta subunit